MLTFLNNRKPVYTGTFRLMGFAPNTAEGALNLSELPDSRGFGTIPCWFEGVIRENGTPISSVLFKTELSRGEATVSDVAEPAYGAPEFQLLRKSASQQCGLASRHGIENRPNNRQQWEQRAAIGTVRGAVATRLDLLRPVVANRFGLSQVNFQL